MVRPNWWHCLLLLLTATGAAGAERVLDSVLPALAYGPACSSTVRLQNLTTEPVAVELEAHRASGALVPLVGLANRSVRLDAGQKAEYQLDIDEETTGAWLKIRETIPESRPGPAVAVSGATECRMENQLRVAAREVAFPMRNPWFSGDIANLRGSLVTIINTSDQPARASACYSAGNLYSLPSAVQPGADLLPLCSATLEVLIPPFGTREIPVERNANSQFSLRTRGDAVVLQMLRPADENVRIYSVDSTIQFGEEVPAAPGR